MLRRNVLIFHQGALGDFVLTWPFALALGRVYAQSRIIYITAGEKGRLAEKVLRLESNDVESGWHSLYADDAEPTGRPAALLGGAHAVYAFQSPSLSWTANVQRLNPDAKVLAIDPRPTQSFSGHVSQWVIEQLKGHPIECAATEQMLRSIADRGVNINHGGRDHVVIHPGSGSPAKCWALDRFIELAERFRQSGRSVRFVVGEVENERWSPDDFERLARAGEVRRPKNYLELLDDISSASVFIGNDSGPGHLAAMVGTPTISLFGTTDPARWKPLGPHVKVISADGLERISVEQVFRSMD